MTIRTHYENLQVTENASSEVIRGAYRYLSQRWHPDKNPDNKAEAERITKIINEAYAVLSDPQQRNEHDLWIRAKREHIAQSSVNNQSVPPPRQVAPLVSPKGSSSARKGAAWGVVAGVIGFVIFAAAAAAGGKSSSQIHFNITTFIFYVVAGAIVGAWGLRR